ncbi:VanZ family protein [Pedobacter glucosidilyticus]|uniref:VanZ family protein n=1 Tax=Pedobacter glucosidilyticus TaxID=1122941 RepID=UPI00040FA179|nr:VanZ family protein [Pedobacter glucosidilyticus]
MLRTIKFQWPAIAWAILVLILCNLPMSPDKQLPLFFEGFDKMVHLGFFFILTVLLLFGKINQQNSYHYRPLTIIKIIIITAAIGGGVEILQWKVFTYRSAEWWDFISDMLGVGAGIFSYLLLHRKSRIIEKV